MPIDGRRRVRLALLTGMAACAPAAVAQPVGAQTPSDRDFAAPIASAARSAVPVAGHPREVVPFTPSPLQRRPTRADALPRFWLDGRSCSTGCRPGARAGWPLVPFRRQHALRAGLNERRLATMHIGVDIQARDGQNVYAIQGGRATIPQRSGGDSRVRVGSFEYWHVVPRVSPGQYVVPYRTVVGTIRSRYGHLHLSEVRGGRYLNPLRPGGRVLSPWVDRAPPVIGAPVRGFDGSVRVRAYDPQSFVVRTTYPTPVLAPAALAYRLRTVTGRPITPLRFALRGSQHYAPSFITRIYTPDARGGGFVCFAYHPRCTPNWHYRLAGGIAPKLPRLGPGRYKLTVYAWDWAGNASARDAPFVVR